MLFFFFTTPYSSPFSFFLTFHITTILRVIVSPLCCIYTMALELCLKLLFLVAFFAVLVSVGLVLQHPSDDDSGKTHAPAVVAAAATTTTTPSTKSAEIDSPKPVRLEATSLLALLTMTSRQQRYEALTEISKLIQLKFDQLSHWRRQYFSNLHTAFNGESIPLLSDANDEPEITPFPRRTPTNKQLRAARAKANGAPARPNVNFVRSQLLATCINKYWDVEPAMQRTRARWTQYPWLFGLLRDFHRQAYYLAQAQYNRKQSENERYWQSIWGDSADFCI